MTNKFEVGPNHERRWRMKYTRQCHSEPLRFLLKSGDRFIAIDGEDVSQMDAKEITAIMSGKSEMIFAVILLR